MLDFINSGLNHNSGSDVDKANFIYRSFQDAGVGTMTYDLLRQDFEKYKFLLDKWHLTGTAVADSSWHKYSRYSRDSSIPLPVTQLFNQADGAMFFTKAQSFTRGGVCRDKATALTLLFQHYGLDATTMAYSATSDGKSYGHAITVVNFKDVGFVGFDPTNYQQPVPLEVPEDYRHMIPAMPDLSKLQPLPIKIK